MMLQQVFCKWCLKSLQMSMEEAAKTIWASIELVAHPKGFCKKCGHIDERKILLNFCSPQCLEEFVAGNGLRRCVNELQGVKEE